MNGTPTLVRASAISAGVAVVVGIAWSLLTPTVHGELTEDGRVAISPTEIPAAFAGVAVFALMMLCYGAVIALVMWRVARSARGLSGLTATVVMALLGTAVAGVIGSLFVGIRTSASGATAGDPVQVVGSLWLDGPTRGGFSSPWVLAICAPVAAVLIYLICTILAKEADLGVGDGGQVQPDTLVHPSQPVGYPQGASAPGHYPQPQPYPGPQYQGPHYPGPQQYPQLLDPTLGSAQSQSPVPPTAGDEGSQTRP